MSTVKIMRKDKVREVIQERVQKDLIHKMTRQCMGDQQTL
jgi:hypothetical protein